MTDHARLLLQDEQACAETKAKLIAAGFSIVADVIDLARPPAFVPTHRHADGGVYRMVQRAKWKGATDTEWRWAVIYEAEDGGTYVTDDERWSDRFQIIAPAAAPQADHEALEPAQCAYVNLGNMVRMMPALRSHPLLGVVKLQLRAAIEHLGGKDFCDLEDADHG